MSRWLSISHISLVFLCIVLIHFKIVHSSNAVPKSFQQRLLERKNIVGSATVLTTGVVGKKIYDGPIFNENVDLTGKEIVITGANTGLGKDSAISLASKGANIYILCRSETKGLKAVQEIKEKSKNDNVEYLSLDLASLKSIDNCANELKKKLKKIDVLQLNAGVMAIPDRQTTQDDFEYQLGVNHLGHFKLTGELLGLLKKSENGRIISVSSSAHMLGKLNFDDLLLEKDGAYSAWQAYGNSKLANVLFTRELADRLGKDSSIVAVTLHPGACRTELGRYIVDPDSIPKALVPILGVAISPLLYFTKSSYMGSQTQTFLSASKTITPANNGLFYDNSVPADTSKEAKDVEARKKLWELSEQLTNVRYDF